MKKTIILDLDGTFYPMSQLPLKLFADTFRAKIANLDILEDTRIAISNRCKEQQKAGLYNYIYAIFDGDSEKFHIFCNKVINLIDYSKIVPNPQLLETLNLLKKSYNVVVLTNNVDFHVRKVFLRLFGVDDINIDVYDICFVEKDGYFRSKRIDGLSLFCEKLGLHPQDCILVDDLQLNLDAATKIQMKSLLVKKDSNIVDLLKSSFL